MLENKEMGELNRVVSLQLLNMYSSYHLSTKCKHIVRRKPLLEYNQ